MKNTLLETSFTSHRLTPSAGSEIFAILRSGQNIRKFNNLPVDVCPVSGGIEIRTPYFCIKYDNVREVSTHGNSRACAICLRDEAGDPLVTLFRLAEHSQDDADALVAELNAFGSPAFYFEKE